MAHRIVFYPVGNGDTSQIILENGKRFLFDFHHCNAGECEAEPIIDLATQLKTELKEVNKDYFDVVAFTHADNDHIKGSTGFFELLYAKKYQGEGRIKIKELWVPAAMIIESASNDDQSDEFVILRQEARDRLKEGKGIRVFSKPNQLKDWLENEGIKLKDRLHLITDAGKLVPNFDFNTDNVEFFCHSPFVKKVDGLDNFRNKASLVLNIRFKVKSEYYDYLSIGDTDSDVLSEIVDISEYRGNSDRLKWDIFNIPHHCSSLALGEDKGATETVPTESIKKLLKKGKVGAYMISSSRPIKNEDQKQPPHFQARNCYKKYLKECHGTFLVTMEEPTEKEPKPIEIKIGEDGVSIVQKCSSGSATILVTSTPRAG